MPRYRYCICCGKSFDVKRWKLRAHKQVDFLGNTHEVNGYTCPSCQKRYGKRHVCGSILHPVDDEVFGPAAKQCDVYKAGWERPTDLIRQLGIRSRKTLLRLRHDGLLQSWVYGVTPWNFRRAYQPAASSKELGERIAFYEGIGNRVAVKLTYRSLLDDAGINYEDGERTVCHRGLEPALVVEKWVAAVVEHGNLLESNGVFDPDDRRPYWQKKRMFKLAAIAWGRADQRHRDAIESAALIPQAGGTKAVQQLLHAQITIEKETPYLTHREGQRTQQAARGRRLQWK